MSSTFNPQIHHRRSIRLKGYDYTQAGAYFVTICTHNKECLFGNVVDGEMVLNEFGKIVEYQWLQIPHFFSCASLDEFRVMPNYIHGIVVIHETTNPLFPVGAKHPEQKDAKALETIPRMLRPYKAVQLVRNRDHCRRSSRISFPSQLEK